MTTFRTRRAAAALAALSVLAACSEAPVATPVSPTTAPTTAAPSPTTTSPSPTVTPTTPTPSPTPTGRVPTGEPITIAFGGDIHFEGSSGAALDDPSLLDPIGEHLASADLAIANLETAVTTGGTPADKAYTFRAPPSAFTALERAGIDVVSLANNHGMDFGESGLRDTIDNAEAAGFPIIGIGLDDTQAYAPYRTTVRGQRIAVIGATQVLDSVYIGPWTAGPDKPGLASAKEEERLLRAVREARPDTDTLIVYLHWGQERNSCPIGVQADLAPKLLEAGADIVVGTHAHVLLGSGWLEDGYVDYGLGNFVFYARPGIGAQTGVLRLTVEGRAVTDAEWRPAEIRSGIPLPLSGEAAQAAVRAREQLRTCTGLSGEPPEWE